MFTQNFIRPLLYSVSEIRRMNSLVMLFSYVRIPSFNDKSNCVYLPVFSSATVLGDTFSIARDTTGKG